eukprot:TRINITY_DN75974_c0_g1_i1.p1 TRINITY_DN75974_c0_g1~~TRINITY_DN75974_c0_g1_i1.p1  ORF type:complete len:428 (-),score=58.43 TRINITY_DN75974_c0_g1_i1:98-1381(-)
MDFGCFARLPCLEARCPSKLVANDGAQRNDSCVASQHVRFSENKESGWTPGIFTLASAATAAFVVWMQGYWILASLLIVCGAISSSVTGDSSKLEPRNVSALKGRILTDASLENFRPSPDEIAKSRARGEDPFASLRLNYLAGTNVPFETVSGALNSTELARFEEFERKVLEKLSSCPELDRTRFHQLPDKFTMLIFLQADNYDVEKAVARLVSTVLWRQTSGLDDFISNPDDRAWYLYYHLRPRRLVGYDKHHRPVMLDALGEFFGSDNGCSALPMHQWMQCFGYEMSLLQCSFRRTSVRHNKPIHRIAYIGDLSGLRVGQARRLIPLLRAFTSEVERHFPECAGTVVLINAPKIFAFLWRLVQSFVDPKTVATMSVHSGVPTAFLCESFGEDVVPVEWGGKLNYKVTRVRPVQEVWAEACQRFGN